jgi:hypothetical protein
MSIGHWWPPTTVKVNRGITPEWINLWSLNFGLPIKIPDQVLISNDLHKGNLVIYQKTKYGMDVCTHMGKT